MSRPDRLRLYLDDGLRESAAAGHHNFLRQVIEVAKAAGLAVELRPDTPSERAKARLRRGYALYHMHDPGHDGGMTFRRVYHYPFWAIEAHGERWRWRVSRAAFPEEQPHPDATRFYQHWRRKLFGATAEQATREGVVYVPLQGRLLEQRSFQACAPLEMVEHVLDADPVRRVLATLHPKERYAPAEMAALESLAARYPRLTVSTGEMERWLSVCDYVVTQNSSAAFNGYFFAKPAILFAKIDFHHIAANVHRMGIDEALRAGPDLAPDYAAYIHWFWQRMSINAGRPEAHERIRDALRAGGWPV